MPKILAITEEMLSRSKSMHGKASRLKLSQDAMGKAVENLQPFFCGALPELMTEKLKETKKAREAIVGVVKIYASKVATAANTYDWTDDQISKLTANFGIDGSAGGKNTGMSFDPKYYNEYLNNTYQCVGYVKGRLKEFLGIEGSVPVNGGDFFDSWGNGKEVVENLKKRYIGQTLSEKGGDVSFTLEDCPTIGNFEAPAIASFTVLKNGADNGEGHVVFIENVWSENGTTWVEISEANALAQSAQEFADGVKHKVPLEDFKHLYDGVLDVVTIKKA